MKHETPPPGTNSVQKSNSNQNFCFSCIMSKWEL